MASLVEYWNELKAAGIDVRRRKDACRVLRRGTPKQSSDAELLGWPEIPRSRNGSRESTAQYYRNAYGGDLTAAIKKRDMVAAAEALSYMGRRWGVSKAREIAEKSRADVFICESCGNFKASDQRGHDNICAECVADYYFQCATCNELTACGARQNSPDGDLCPSCFQKKFFFCPQCGEVGSLDVAYGAQNGRFIHEECAEAWHYWIADGLYHNEPEDETKVANPNQGACQKNSKIWKWLTDRAAQGRKRTDLASETIDNNGFNAIYLLMVSEKIVSDDAIKPGTDERWNSAGEFYNWLRQQRNGHPSGLLPATTKEGTIPKRIAKWCYKNLKVKLTSDFLGKLGDTAAQYCPQVKGIDWEVVLPPFAWEAGQFGDAGSCFWGSRSKARYQMNSQHNAFAIRVYDEERNRKPPHGIGRCWIIVQDGIAFVFNAYGPHNTLAMARLLATACGANYHACKLLNNGQCSGGFYANNGGEGYAVGFVSDKDAPREHDFQFEGL